MKASTVAAFWLGLILAAGCDSGKTEATREKSDDSKKDDDDGDDKKKKDKDDEDEAKDEKASAKPQADGPGATTGTAAAIATDGPSTTEGKPATPVTSPELQTYSKDGVPTIPDGCTEAFAVAATAPESVGPDYDWAWTKQAMLANQQYRVVDEEPTGPGEVNFALLKANEKFSNVWVLMAQCNNGSTCNNLVAMLRAITKSKSPQPFCKNLPMDLSWTPVKPMLRDLGSPTNTLPTKDDAKGQCARLQACSVAMDPSKADSTNIGFECQKAPHKFKRECAEKYPCQEVMSCLGQ